MPTSYAISSPLRVARVARAHAAWLICLLLRFYGRGARRCLGTPQKGEKKNVRKYRYEKIKIYILVNADRDARAWTPGRGSPYLHTFRTYVTERDGIARF